MDSGYSRYMTRNTRLFSNFDPMIGKEYITFKDDFRCKVISHETILRCTLRRAFLLFWMVSDILFVKFLHLDEL
jgi:hypothetical protein